MASKKFDIMSAAPGQVNQLLNQASKDLGGRGKKMTFLPREMLMPLPGNTTVYHVSDLDAIAKDMASAGVRQPLIVFKNEHGKYYVLAGNRRLAASELAMKKYGADLGSMPCIIQAAPEEDYSLKKRMIKDNLQRVKSGHERMMEIIVFENALKEERAANPEGDYPPIREALQAELGVTNSEITRYLKIYKNLIPALMSRFDSVCGEDDAPAMATDIAFKLAKEPEEFQLFVAETYDWQEPLTNSKLTSLFGMFYGEDGEDTSDEVLQGEASPSENGAEMAQEKPKPTKVVVDFESVDEGARRLSLACDTLNRTVTVAGGKPLDKKVEKRFLKRIAAEMAKVEALAAELQAFYDGNENA